ncbi:hypothetical protein BGZ58_001891, partial [Dissophora ornata]
MKFLSSSVVLSLLVSVALLQSTFADPNVQQPTGLQGPAAPALPKHAHSKHPAYPVDDSNDNYGDNYADNSADNNAANPTDNNAANPASNSAGKQSMQRRAMPAPAQPKRTHRKHPAYP